MRLSTHILSVLVALAAVACSAGNVGNDGKLPTLDGANLSNVTATKIGETTAEQVKAGLATITNATDVGTAATLVKRDASGNFAANTVTATLVGFATGKKGADLTVSGSTLTFGPDGNFFDVIAGGGATEVTAIATMPAGTRITVRFKTTLWLRHSASLALKGKGDFRVVAGDVFELLSLGNGSWMEVSRAVGKESAFEATIINSADTYAPADYRSVRFAEELIDNQDEYNPATGQFFPKQAGIYLITLRLITTPASWSAGEFCEARIDFDFPAGITPIIFSIQSGRAYMPTVGAGSCSAQVSAAFFLPAGAIVHPQIYIGSGNSNTTIYNNAQTHNVFSAVRIGNVN